MPVTVQLGNHMHLSLRIVMLQAVDLGSTCVLPGCCSGLLPAGGPVTW